MISGTVDHLNWWRIPELGHIQVEGLRPSGWVRFEVARNGYVSVFDASENWTYTREKTGIESVCHDDRERSFDIAFSKVPHGDGHITKLLPVGTRIYTSHWLQGRGDVWGWAKVMGHSAQWISVEFESDGDKRGYPYSPTFSALDVERLNKQRPQRRG